MYLEGTLDLEYPSWKGEGLSHLLLKSERDVMPM